MSAPGRAAATTAGLFVAVEGIDHSGKTTLTRSLAEQLRGAGLRVAVWMEPSTGPFGTMLRQLSAADAVPAVALALLSAADRHAAQAALAAAVAAHDVVVSDRYYLSGLAYHLADGIDIDFYRACAVGVATPHVYLYLDVTPEVAAARVCRPPDSRWELPAFAARLPTAYERAMAAVTATTSSSVVRLDAHQPVTAVLSAAVVLTPRVVLDIGGDVGTVKLTGGATLPEAAAIYTGSGRILLHGVTVTSISPATSADPASGQPAPAAPGRPFIVVSTGGRLDATDVTVTDLGTAGDAPEPRPAISFHSGTGGSVVRATFTRNTTALQLQRTQDVRLEDVTVTDSMADGLELSGDRGTTVNRVRAERNGGNGVTFDGTTTDHPITGITTSGNGRFGVAAVRLQNARLEDLRITGDAAGGLELSRSANVTVSGLTAVDEPIGVFAHIGSTGITLDRLVVRGGRRGVAVEKTATHLVLRASTFDAVKLAGVVIGGTAVELRDVAVSDTQTGVRIERGAADVTAIGLRLTGGRDGVVATAGTAGVVLHDLSAVGVENDAVRSFSPDARILGGTIVGATTGVTAGAATTISRVSMSLVNGGIRARSPGLARRGGRHQRGRGRYRRRRGQPGPARRLAGAGPGGGARRADRVGHERAEPAPAESARRHRHPAGPAGARSGARARRPPAPRRARAAVDAAGGAGGGGAQVAGEIGGRGRPVTPFRAPRRFPMSWPARARQARPGGKVRPRRAPARDRVSRLALRRSHAPQATRLYVDCHRHTLAGYRRKHDYLQRD